MGKASIQRRDAETQRSAQRTPWGMGSGGGSEAFDLTRRRGGAEEDAEKAENKGE
jgi:hypothetical protein